MNTMSPISSNSLYKVQPWLHRVPYKPFQHKLKVSVSEGIYLIDFEDIVRVQACGNYSIIHYKGGIITASKSLKHFENQLPNKQFIRVHSSHLIALQQIIFISKSEIKLKDGTFCPISRRGKALLNELVKN